MPPKPIPKNVINPFSDAFVVTWDLWKHFRWEEHKFQYKGVISEQMALKRLVEVSEGDEEKAIRIVEQSISRGWMDFYKLKQPSNNGKSATKSNQSTTNDQKSGSSLKERVFAATVKKFGGGEQDGGESNIKAI